MAMGSPLGLARSVSFGVVSSVNRYLPDDQMPAGAATGLYNTWIQTDAAINPGNSGGPLVDLEGRVVGINSRAVPIFGENVGFAIPINIVKEVAKSLIAKGAVQRSWIGAYWQPLKVLPNYLDMSDKRGVVVGGVDPGSPAEKAGLQVGDVVVSYNGRPVTVRYEEELPAFRKTEADTPIGSRVPLTVSRRGETLRLALVTVNRTTEESEDYECREWGFTVRALNDEIARVHNLDISRGVIVTGVKRGSFAADAEIAAGDIIMRIEKVEPKDLKSFEGQYEELVAAKAARILFVTKRGQVLHFHVLKPSYEPASPRSIGIGEEEDENPEGGPGDEEGPGNGPEGPDSGGM
jgi:serine protease Do